MAKARPPSAARVLTIMSGLDADGFAASAPSGAREHEGICFRDCDLSGADFGPWRLVDCTFEACNLTLATWRNAALRNVTFRACKLLGADLSVVRAAFLALTFEDCKLDYVNFGGLDLSKTRFSQCSLVDASFVGTNLAGAAFEACEVPGALFRNTNLTGADLRGADGLVLDPDANRLQKARLSLQGLPGLLTKYQLDID